MTFTEIALIIALAISIVMCVYFYLSRERTIYNANWYVDELKKEGFISSSAMQKTIKKERNARIKAQEDKTIIVKRCHELLGLFPF